MVWNWAMCVGPKVRRHRPRGDRQPVGARSLSHRRFQDRLQLVAAEDVTGEDAFPASFNGGDR